MNKSKNLFTDGLVYAKSNCNISDGVVTQQNADTNTHLYWKVQSFSGVNLVADILHIEKNDTGKLSIPFTKKSTFNRINLGLNGSQIDTVIFIEVGHLKNDVQYVISFEITNVTQGSISWKNIQIEEGNEATSFEPYVNPRLQVKNNAGGYEDFFKPILLGVTKSAVVKDGDIEVIRTGNIVIVEVCDIELTEERAEWNTCIAEGLPKPMLLPVPGIWRKSVLADESEGTISVDLGGNLSISTRTGKQPTNKTYNGQFIYVTTD